MSQKDLLAREIPFEVRQAAIDTEGIVYVSRIRDNWFLYRVLTYREYKKSQRILTALESFDYENYLIDTCLIYPESWKKIPALWIPSIAANISNVSGFDNPAAFEQTLVRARGNMMSLEPGIDVFLKTSLLLKDEELDKMTFMERLNLVAYGEVVTQKQIPIGEEDKRRRKKPPKNFPIDMAGLEGAFDGGSNTEVLQTDPHGRTKLERTTESFSVTNTRLRDR